MIIVFVFLFPQQVEYVILLMSGLRCSQSRIQLWLLLRSSLVYFSLTVLKVLSLYIFIMILSYWVDRKVCSGFHLMKIQMNHLANSRLKSLFRLFFTKFRTFLAIISLDIFRLLSLPLSLPASVPPLLLVFTLGLCWCACHCQVSVRLFVFLHSCCSSFFGLRNLYWTIFKFTDLSSTHSSLLFDPL